MISRQKKHSISLGVCGLRSGGLIILFALLLGCGGGSGGGDELSRDSCHFQGFGGKVLFGTQCDRSQSAVVQIGIAPPGETPSLCSGTLISPQHVLTAGHCVPDLPNGVFVNAGASNMPIPARRIFVHPGFYLSNEVDRVYNDAAIIELVTPAAAPVAPILSIPVIAGDHISVFGYGVDENGFSGVLRSGELRVTGVDQNFIDALFGGEGVNSCLGDSGGPIVAEKVDSSGHLIAGVVGIVSTGTDPLCQIGDVSTYTNVQVAGAIDFIRAVVPTVQIL